MSVYPYESRSYESNERRIGKWSTSVFTGRPVWFHTSRQKLWQTGCWQGMVALGLTRRRNFRVLVWAILLSRVPVHCFSGPVMHRVHRTWHLLHIKSPQSFGVVLATSGRLTRTTQHNRENALLQDRLGSRNHNFRLFASLVPPMSPMRHLLADSQLSPNDHLDQESLASHTEYEKLVRRLYSINLFHPVKLGLTNMYKLHELLGNPMDDVSGRNGISCFNCC